MEFIFIATVLALARFLATLKMSSSKVLRLETDLHIFGLILAAGKVALQAKFNLGGHLDPGYV